MEFYNKEGMNVNKYGYFKKLFEGNLKVGSEIELEFDDDSSIYYRTLKDEFNRSPSYKYFGNNSDGVYDVKGDGSLNNGLELVTTGRFMYDINAIHLQNKKIFNKVHEMDWEYIISQRTGMHQHMLITEYGGSESQIEMPLDNLFFKNFVIMFKNYFLPILWFTSAIYYKSDDSESFMRYSGFSEYQKFFDTNFNRINTNKPSEIRSKINASNRYSALNLTPMNIRRVDGEDMITNFHIEFRISDGFIFPSQLTIQNDMFKGLILSALKLSLVGEIKDLEERDIHIIKAIKNNPTRSSYPSDRGRYSQTDIGYIEVVMPTIKERCNEFIELIKEHINVNTYMALQRLIEKNVSLRLKDMHNEEISDTERAIKLEEGFKDLYEYKSGIVNTDLVEKVLNKEINLNNVEEICACSKEMQIDLDNFLEQINTLKRNGVV